MLYVAKSYKIRFIRSQRIFLSGNLSFANFLYRRVHQFYLKKKIYSVDGYFSLLIDNLDNMKARLQLLIEKNYKNLEIIAHPKKMTILKLCFF